MNPIRLSVIVLQHAERILLASNKPITPESKEEQGRWMFSLWHAQDVHEMTHKDVAEMFLAGVPATGSVYEECVAMVDPDPECDMSSEFVDYISEL